MSGLFQPTVIESVHILRKTLGLNWRYTQCAGAVIDTVLPCLGMVYSKGVLGHQHLALVGRSFAYIPLGKDGSAL